MFSWSTGEKWKSSLLIIFLLIRFILGCYSNFLIAISSGFSFALIPSERIAFSNKLINEFATLASSEIISRFSTKDIFGKDVTLSDKKGSTVYQNSLLSVTFVKSSIFFFSIWVFFYEHSRITGLQGKGEGISLTPHYHFHPLHRHLDISQAITAESSPLHIASNRTRTGNLWFPSASR